MALSWAVGHEERQKMGLRIFNQDDLSPSRWAALQGLCRGRNLYEEEADKLRKQKG